MNNYRGVETGYKNIYLKFEPATDSWVLNYNGMIVRVFDSMPTVQQIKNYISKIMN